LIIPSLKSLYSYKYFILSKEAPHGEDKNANQKIKTEGRGRDAGICTLKETKNCSQEVDNNQKTAKASSHQ
jgi:hypothetical protein